uniref:Uncharacterized protein n=1 Tax=Quercus lobata TaxID=97700 RepID=A0A7N2LIV0_QUELO
MGFSFRSKRCLKQWKPKRPISVPISSNDTVQCLKRHLGFNLRSSWSTGPDLKEKHRGSGSYLGFVEDGQSVIDETRNS